MSLPALHHRKLTTAIAASNGIADMLDAIWAAVQPSVTTYTDGTTRVFTSGGTGWTWSRYQLAGVTQAVYASPPGGALNQRVILAGSTTTPSPSPTMIVDAFLANRVMIGINKNSGAFNAWNAALPFTAGQWSGYVAVGGNSPTAPVTFTVIETEETIHIGMTTASAGAMFGAGAGAMIDPDTGDAADSESDGRIYGMWTGGTTTFGANMLGSGVAGTFMAHGTSANNSHFFSFTPGNGVMHGTARENYFFGVTSASRTTRSGKFPATVMYAIGTTAWAGRIREMRVIRPATFGQRVDVAGVNKGYISAPSTTTPGDSVLMEY